MGTIIVSPQPMRRMVSVLWQFEGARALRVLVPAAASYLTAPLLALAGTAGSIALGASLELGSILAASLLALASTTLASLIWRRRPWRALIANRLWTYERVQPETVVPVLVQDAVAAETMRPVLRRDGLSPSDIITRLGTAPVDAPDLIFRMTISEPDRCRRSVSDADRVDRIATLFERCGIRARVAGVDVGAVGTPATLSSTDPAAT